MNIYSVEQLRFSYDGKFTLFIEKFEMGESCVGLVGPSGSGKTTLLLNLALLLKGTWKKFQFLEEDVTETNMERLRRRVTYVAQHPILLRRTVFENIAYPLLLRRISKEKITERVEMIAQLFDLKDLLNKKPWQLSGGQAKRACLARAFVFEPKVILLDEPTADLDEKSRRILNDVLRIYSDRTSFIIVSHEIDWLSDLCEKIYAMNDGVLKGMKS
ncbi:MAG: ABC transporter related [Thermotoga sp. 50_1627]|uniref:energy-coupling factor ABC transporter ATP-binding protein n=1 Tax=Pseudothermotoga sp. TaxID=2033661 RepID=UPI00076CFC2A|nr:MAG: ABC transporter related [Thermotoga sp. 50_64]KUK24736.1 MAG: ABC transporter related [Thermotoga sp. 50_1627]MBC7116501.1 ABC transporter ATP-binding protein [Pseudothermotoga sp.]MDK2923110.1 tungstate transport system ATP-binding protein [Pseudothermotoga sp.]HBT40359.1 ABC transporter [Pseudothermotoga sp.]